jgi:hypothetical protein
MHMRILAKITAIGCAAASLIVPAATGAMPDKAFFVSCGTSHVKQVDPIVAPGPERPSGHMHEFFGNTTTDSSSAYETMVAGATTCTAAGDTAGYWVPTLIATGGREVRAQSVNAYYRAVGALASRPIVAFPPDLRMVASRSFFHCGSAGTGTTRPKDCGSRSLHASIRFPACWDGVNTDSLDHLSHMAYQTGRGCPSTHPVAVPRLVVVVRYKGVHDGRGYTLSSGRPSSMHADFWNTWDQEALSTLVQSCLNEATTTCGLVRT